MSTTLVTGIGLLVTHDDERPERTGAALVIDDGRVAWVGDAADAPDADERIEVGGRCVIPGFVDSHSHLMFAGDRADEFEARMAGRRYEAGGIRRTVRLTREASDDELLANARRLLAEARAQGTTTIEIKSGYGLTVDDEARALRLAGQLTPETTYLGAHVVPDGITREEYVDLVCGDMLAACAPHARWIDAFCETGAFTLEETRRILTAGVAAGLVPRLHAAQLGPNPEAIALGVELGAASIDHCTYLTDADLDALAGSGTVATLLPGVEFSTKHPYPDARKLVDAGAAIALACDCNPGSSYTTSMAFCIALAVREMGLTPYEALHAATLGGARALRRDDIGTLRLGARADLVVLNAPTYVHLAYRPGVPLVHRVL
ncbi:MAG TPA: imidazolonepropionase [Pseudolysinimonas sp.]|nr:imidazolonepropionase [Pseudolysinimonas sp.]